MEGIELDAETLGPTGERFLKFASARMKGQDKAIRRLAKALDHAESPLRVRNRPIYSVLVVGGAGSGKTHLARVLAEFWFDNPDGLTVSSCTQIFKTSFGREAFTKHDFNFQLKGKNNSLLVSYIKIVNEKEELEQKLRKLMNKEEIRLLKIKLEEKTEEYKKIYCKVEPIIQNLRSIIVLDHIEEANPSFQEFLEDILDRGALSVQNDNESWRISFANTIIFITCNNCVTFEEGHRDSPSKIGFMLQVSQSGRALENGGSRYLRGMPEVKDYFSSKFLSRLDRVEILTDYSNETLNDIVNLFFAEFNEWLKERFPVFLVVEDEIKKFIVREGSDHPEFGIRLLKNKFDKYIRHKLELLRQKKLINENDSIRVHLDKKEGKDIVAFTKLDIPQLPSK